MNCYFTISQICLMAMLFVVFAYGSNIKPTFRHNCISTGNISFFPTFWNRLTTKVLFFPEVQSGSLFPPVCLGTTSLKHPNYHFRCWRERLMCELFILGRLATLSVRANWTQRRDHFRMNAHLTWAGGFVFISDAFEREGEWKRETEWESVCESVFKTANCQLCVRVSVCVPPLTLKTGLACIRPSASITLKYRLSRQIPPFPQIALVDLEHTRFNPVVDISRFFKTLGI